MTDKVQKIREWVKARLDENNSKQSIPQFYGMMEEDARFLDFLDTMQEESVSEDLEEASKEWLRPQLDKSYANYGEAKMMELTHFDGYAMLDAIEFGAKWQKAKDQETIETAIHHAYHNGRLEMKEQMMKNAVEVPIEEAVPFGSCKWKLCAKLWLDKGVKGNKVKLVIIKDE